MSEQISLSAENKQMIANSIVQEAVTRSRFISSAMGQYFGGNRDVYNSMGYPRTIMGSMYYDYWRRHPIAKRVVKIFPNACWRLAPEILENEKSTSSKFEAEINEIIDNCKLFKYMKKADTLAGIGNYGLLFLGFDDERDYRETATGKLTYLQAYDAVYRSKISKYVTDITNERYGLPELYEIDFGSDGQSNYKLVHWTRVIHIAEDAEDNDTFGTPRMEDVFNNLVNIEYISAASAEGYWRGGFPGLAMELDKEAPLNNKEYETKMDEMVNDWVDGFRRNLIGVGANFKTLQPNAESPEAFFLLQIQEICASKEIPLRIMLGSERGNLASSQDEDNWNAKVDDRRVNFCEPNIVRAFVDRMIYLKAITPPTNGKYQVVWQDLKSKDEKRQAEIAKIKTEALEKYSNSPALQMIMPPDLYLRFIMQLSDEEVDTVKESMGKVEDDDMTMPDDDDTNEEETPNV